MIGKRLGSAYRSRRSNDWIKLKCQLRQEFVIVGYTEPKGSRRHIGALLLGLYSPDEERRLRYAGKVGSGFTAASLKKVRERLEPSRSAPAHWRRCRRRARPGRCSGCARNSCARFPMRR